jgi:acid phosphatase type 7
LPRFLVIGAAAIAASAALAGATAAGRGSRATAPTIRISRVSVIGRVAKIFVRIRGAQRPVHWRIFVDRAYNNFSVDPKLGLALNLAGGRHRITVDLLGRRGRVASSPPRVVRIRTTRDPVVAAAGDIACDPADPGFHHGKGLPGRCRQRQTAALVAGARPAAVLALGDVQYECGASSAFRSSYARDWGRFYKITRPVPGNHEYGTDNGTFPFKPTCEPTNRAARGYFGYFPNAGPPGGYYSYNIGSWHLVALNSECSFIGGCRGGSTEERWLRADLASNSGACTLVYWHRPLWSPSAQLGGERSVETLWKDVVAAGADLVLNGHVHLYARFVPLDPNGRPDPRGVTQIIVGTGGKSLFPLAPPVASTVAAEQSSVFGILELTLHSGSYEWQYVPQRGSTFVDYGSRSCH